MIKATQKKPLFNVTSYLYTLSSILGRRHFN